MLTHMKKSHIGREKRERERKKKRKKKKKRRESDPTLKNKVKNSAKFCINAWTDNVNKKSMLDITNNSVNQASYFQQIAKTHLFIT